MSKRSHNKKRNVGIIYEQLLSVISRALVENDKKTALKAKQLVKRFFRPDTELYKEHRLFNALAVTRLEDGSLATRIINEAKNASRMHNTNQLDREKSMLVREINRAFGQSFYKTRVKNYTDYATIQTLLNEWRSYSTKDMTRLAEYESKVHGMLLRENVVIQLENQVDPEISGLVVKIMTEKFNKKFGASLSDDQKILIKEYVFSQNGDSTRFESTLNSIRQKTIRELSNFRRECGNSVVLAKIDPVIRSLKEIRVSEINDQTMARFLTLCQLQKELKGEA